VVLESEWRFAAGQTVRAETRFLDPLPDAGLIALQLVPVAGEVRADAPLNLPLMGFVSQRPPQKLSLLRDFIPQRGARQEATATLVYYPAQSETQVVLITVTAF
jgi:hypothetical protein